MILRWVKSQKSQNENTIIYGVNYGIVDWNSREKTTIFNRLIPHSAALSNYSQLFYQMIESEERTNERKKRKKTVFNSKTVSESNINRFMAGLNIFILQISY